MKCLTLIVLALAIPTMGMADSLSFRSDLQGYEAKALQDLPKNTLGHTQTCPRAGAKSPSGQMVEAAGWQVISELSVAGYDLVSFAGQSNIGPEGVCEFLHSNLGVFSGTKLQGIFWGQKEDGQLFGSLEADGSNLVTIDNTAFPIVPVATLTFADQSFVLHDLPATFTGCQGLAEVPNLWMQPIGKMRESLIALGWSPLRFTPTEIISEAFHSYGFTETESCTGTGQNYCSFEYEKPQAKLRIITIGEMGETYQPIVVDYELLCKPAAQ